MTDELRQYRQELSRRSHPISGGLNEPGHAELDRVAAWCKERGVTADVYGEGKDLARFEDRVAELLGLPAARFMPSGTMAQQIAARIWSERTGIATIGMHPTSHLELHEKRGYQRIHGLDSVLVGAAHVPITTDDLLGLHETISCLIVELPTRENGGQLTSWSGLLELSEMAKERGISLHLDGARLWEAAAGYGHTLHEICGLFDSVYVSFYKGIDALPGAMLAGSPDFVAEAAVWQRRHGGNLYNQLANWASADMRLDAQIAKMPAYLQRARELAAALGEVDGLRINPSTPHVNMFHVFLSGDIEELATARDLVAESSGLWLFGSLRPSAVPDIQAFEVTAGDAALDLDIEKVVAAFESLLR